MKKLVSIILLIVAASASTPAQDRAQGASKLSGQVVCCEDCWAEADRKTTPFGTREDLEKASECVANGDPTLLAVENAEGGFTFYELQAGKYKRPGKNWLEFIGKRVEVTGPTGKKKDRSYIKVDALSVLAPAPAESEPEGWITGFNSAICSP